jgi:hypothetical protein
MLALYNERGPAMFDDPEVMAPPASFWAWDAG